ncbi:MAG: gluconeogenesis factor YvcK family protein [Aggregatilineales bacterium]
MERKDRTDSRPMSRKSAAPAKWLTLGIGIKRWLLVFAAGIGTTSLGLSYVLLELHLRVAQEQTDNNYLHLAGLLVAVGVGLTALALVKFSRNLLAPYRSHRQGHVADVVYEHRRRGRGVRVVAIGGGTGLPAVLRGLKLYTDNITAVVTVADDGGSSGRLRRELGVLPPGDLRNNIAALADDENLMTRLFQYRFSAGDLNGHAFGNLFITALAGVTGSLEQALVETERVLNIQGRVLPATLHDVTLTATVRLPNGRITFISGESSIAEAGGHIERVQLSPASVEAYPQSVQAILDADIVVIGPGSLYTSIIPNLLVRGIVDALRASPAYKIYVCNVATQPGETDGFTVAEHVLALEDHIGRGLFQVVLANNAYPALNAGSATNYVQLAPPHHEIFQRYDVRTADLTDAEHPWRHDAHKLATAILNLSSEEKTRSSSGRYAVADTHSLH